MHPDRRKIIDALTALAVVLDKDLTPAALTLYARLLAPFAAEDVLRAIDRAAADGKFFPKPAELLDVLTGRADEREADPVLAWRVVLDALERVGGYDDARFEDGAIAAAVEGLGGWTSLAEMTGDELTLQRIPHQFAILYREAARRGRRRPAWLKGRISRDNAAHGHAGLASPEGRARTIGEIMSPPGERAETEEPAGPTQPLHHAALTLTQAGLAAGKVPQ